MKYLLIITLSLILFSCKKEDEEDPVSSIDYIPLQVGNEWQYIGDSYQNNIDYISIHIEEKVSINDKIYYKLLINDSSIDVPPQELLIRKADDGKYYQYKDGQEHIYRIFEDGLYLDITYEGDKLNCYSSENEFETEIGKFDDVKIVAVGAVEVDGGHTDIYSSGYGLIERNWFGGRWELNYLKVGDKIMGQKR